MCLLEASHMPYTVTYALPDATHITESFDRRECAVHRCIQLEDSGHKFIVLQIIHPKE